MAGSRTEKYTVIYRNTKRCEFHDIGQYIIATSVIGGKFLLILQIALYKYSTLKSYSAYQFILLTKCSFMRLLCT